MQFGDTDQWCCRWHLKMKFTMRDMLEDMPDRYFGRLYDARDQYVHYATQLKYTCSIRYTPCTTLDPDAPTVDKYADEFFREYNRCNDEIRAVRVIHEWWIRTHYDPNGPYRAVLERSYAELKRRARSPPPKRQKCV